jgi:hypothetical protein
LVVYKLIIELGDNISHILILKGDYMNEEIERENREMNEVWDKAIYNARKAFRKTFDDAGYDAAFWTIVIISHSISSDFDGILETKTWDEIDSYGFD